MKVAMTIVTCMAATFVLWPAYAPLGSAATAPPPTTFMPPEVLSAADTRYPIRSIGAGVVVLAVSLNADGAVERIYPLLDRGSLTDAAAASVRSWNFQPASEHGRPRPSELVVAFVFRPPVAQWVPPRFRPVFPVAAADNIGTSGHSPPGILSVAYAAYPINTVASGSVVVQVSVDQAGNTVDVEVLRGLLPFTPLVVEAAKRWRFQPATLHGQPVAFNVPIAFVFERPVLNPPRPQPNHRN